ncbi:MAG: hypothetical protein GC164_15855 [Phycisphaera sp.]|nr:hypothetical protein [Phycisphaera sp.]
MDTPVQTHTRVTLANPFVTVSLDTSRATITLTDSHSDERLLDATVLGGPLLISSTISVEDPVEIDDALGHGKRLVVEVTQPEIWRYTPHRTTGRPQVTRVYAFTLYDNRPALVMGFGLRMPTYMSMRLMGASPMGEGRLFGGQQVENLRTLNGAAGAEPTRVLNTLTRHSLNSLMLTGQVAGKRRSAVWGGLHQRDFAKVATLENGLIGLHAEDPVGRLVDEEETYWAPDTFYLDVHTCEPFEALEQYGWALRLANDARPQVYDFPVLCGWSVGHVSKLPDINTSARLVEELDHANAAGLTRYTRVAIRLEPDKYHNDTEQGWWDDEHMRRFGHLVEPYDTIVRWSKALGARHGVPYIYMQLGMPSDDYARTHPQHMLFNDVSEVDRRHPKFQEGERKHPHHQPYVTYDYTDKDFARHVVESWRRMRNDGIRGVKIDYPESAWRPEGGFDDRYATTTQAYRRAFELIREGMGQDGLIDERNLGESGRPCLDVTAGIIDTQRTWMDSNAFVPEMVSISGLRWYKNRSVFNYYSDTKAVHGLEPGVLRSLVTMNFLTSGRLDLSTSFSFFTPEITHAVSRTYPHYPEPITARPLDAFTGNEHPQVYDLVHDSDWHQVALFNTGDKEAVVGTSISGERADNAVGLDPRGEYHAYEFWSDQYLGKLPGTGRLQTTLAPLHCAMVSLRKALDRPQVLSTDRHVLQGWVELSDVHWDPSAMTLQGKAHVIGGEAMKIVISLNGYKHAQASARQCSATTEIDPDRPDLLRLTLRAAETCTVSWTVNFNR